MIRFACQLERVRYTIGVHHMYDHDDIEEITLDKLDSLWHSPISEWDLIPVSPTSRIDYSNNNAQGWSIDHVE